MFGKSIRLFWWNEKIFHKKEKENYGDLLGCYLVEKISKKEVQFAKPSAFSFRNFWEPIYVTIGSILGNVTTNCVVWGSGIITTNQEVKKATFLAVRGPQTRKRLLALGYQVPEVYGDPALLLSDFYHPEIEKVYDYGIVPHYVDYELVISIVGQNPKILVIDLMTNDIEKTTNEFLKCKKIISSSLHGVIVSHAYGIPAVWHKFSDKVYGDDVKYRDYFESVELEWYRPEEKLDPVNFEDLFVKYPSLPAKKTIENLKVHLMEVCPFKSK